MKKNEEYIVEIIDNGFGGEGIAKVDGQAIFVPGAIQGEMVKIKILKVTSKIAYSKILAVLEKSEQRIDVDCATYAKCGGCSLRHIDYDYTMKMKKAAVENTLQKALGRKIQVDEVLPMEEPFHYRNKLQYPVGVNENGEMVMGVFAERSHCIVPTENCKIQNELTQKIANSVLTFAKENKISGYHEKTRKRNIASSCHSNWQKDKSSHGNVSGK